MTPTSKRRFLKSFGYAAFFCGAFVFMLYLTFPYRALSDLAVAQARKAGLQLSIGSLGPSFPGVKATNVALRLPESMVGAPPAATPTAAAVPAPAPGVAANGGGPAAAATAPAAGPPQSEATAQAIPIDSVKVWPSLFSMGIGYEAHLFGGTVSGSVGLWGKSHVVIHSKGLDLARANAKASVGVDLAGKLDTNIDLVLDPDGTKTTGKVSITGEGLIINGGTVAQYDLPKVELGQLDMALKLDGGKGTVDLFKTQGGDVDAALEGEIALAQKILLSALKLKLKFKPGEDFLKRNSFIQTGLSFAMSKDGRGFYTVNVNRVLGNPGFQPQR